MNPKLECVTFLQEPQAWQISLLHTRAFASLNKEGWSTATFLNFSRDPSCLFLLAKEPQQDQGIAIARHVLDEADLLTLCVHPEYCRRGIGRQLLNQLCLLLAKQGILKIFLEVSCENSPALNLYERTGFTPISTRRNYYRHTDGHTSDAVVMKLSIF